MWKVVFNQVEVFTSNKDVEAIQFALAIHQSSNVSHTIEVIRAALIIPVKDEVVCRLTFKPNEK